MTHIGSLFKVKLVGAESALVAHPNQPDPAAGQGQESWRPGGMQALHHPPTYRAWYSQIITHLVLAKLNVA